MLKVYAWSVCPHCHKAIAWLNEHRIPFEYLEIEEQPQEVIQKVIEVNGGDDWVVPTMEYNGSDRKKIRVRPSDADFFAKINSDITILLIS